MKKSGQFNLQLIPHTSVFHWVNYHNLVCGRTCTHPRDLMKNNIFYCSITNILRWNWLFFLFFSFPLFFKLWVVAVKMQWLLERFGAIAFFFFLLIYLFLAVLGLRFCARASSSCGKRGPLFIAVRGPLTVMASLVAEHRLQTRRLSSCGSRA